MWSSVFLSLFSCVLFSNFFQANSKVPNLGKDTAQLHTTVTNNLSRANSSELLVDISSKHVKWLSYSDAEMIYYVDGLGVCGLTNAPSDFVVALDADLYGNGQYCFSTITITYNDISNQAHIVDEVCALANTDRSWCFSDVFQCPFCPYSGLAPQSGALRKLCSP
ncbi:hypothetical protein SERLA73DRAFT_133725 [Serpula lacrymans var. lacrymans S7.3]|uniref:Uncharacterized protein n=2 Tax=Serpula lacrymans var. lacrymans TaxID=341189 RepID=F8PSA3_SERL3|nr:uncharacterized protein SERLADRAFT_384703 [Serpula lacrymans var. lacrymans S7.9]EGO00716.1 hypothetical protein SERLA73DRAFT_133725 [Serpula lacrymans var. lacrymans S7.3]EGO26263.1 hypothetical protein SERLADRAFT_384703 [Serpula lacrymans var. lacrymans S7.9]